MCICVYKYIHTHIYMERECVIYVCAFMTFDTVSLPPEIFPEEIFRNSDEDVGRKISIKVFFIVAKLDGTIQLWITSIKNALPIY